jgi:hypothetical protein
MTVFDGGPRCHFNTCFCNCPLFFFEIPKVNNFPTWPFLRGKGHPVTLKCGGSGGGGSRDCSGGGGGDWGVTLVMDHSYPLTSPSGHLGAHSSFGMQQTNSNPFGANGKVKCWCDDVKRMPHPTFCRHHYHYFFS